jgi:hypothetical protein
VTVSPGIITRHYQPTTSLPLIQKLRTSLTTLFSRHTGPAMNRLDRPLN